ncbi:MULTISPECIES: hypothetical protein [unclassified Streptomyces]|uniref:hypothetical protein n=1 Tax=unclassified Streptomyces TaxID=2593676 RepID=UPI00224F8409|nr:hypothetical protein [Streptomyces sp. NBC_01264]MCX4783873.1 hypothetical protein [Streptomyces sp. NBC_01264]
MTSSPEPPRTLHDALRVLGLTADPDSALGRAADEQFMADSAADSIPAAHWHPGIIPLDPGAEPPTPGDPSVDPRTATKFIFVDGCSRREARDTITAVLTEVYGFDPVSKQLVFNRELHDWRDNPALTVYVTAFGGYFALPCDGDCAATREAFLHAWKEKAAAGFDDVDEV